MTKSPDSTNLELNYNKLMVLLRWIYGDFKPTDWNETDIRLVRQLKNACHRLECPEFIEEFNIGGKPKRYTNTGREMSKEEIEEADLIQNEQIESLTDMNGNLYCPKCMYRTFEKNSWTQCLICHTPLKRMSRDGEDE